MFETFLFILLPYLAVILAVYGTIYRIWKQQYGDLVMSSQFFEDRKLLWGSMPWHLGIILILLTHLLVLAAPGPWYRLVIKPGILWAVETAGMALAFLCLAGLMVLIWRRLAAESMQPVTSAMDIVMLGLLFAQVGLGLTTAITAHWGAQWSTGTTVPYLWSLLRFQPDASYVVELPLVARAHIVGAWLIILLLPFTNLIHIFAFPWRYAAPVSDSKPAAAVASAMAKVYSGVQLCAEIVKKAKR
jgi:nitrate reductase gamma subunit